MTLRRLVILLLSLFSSPLVWAENTVVEFNPLEKIHGSVAEAVTTANEEAEQAKLEPKYPIEIKADNAEIQTMLENYLPLIAYQRKEVLDKEQVGYLAEDAPTDAKKMIQTEGYFNSEVNVSPQRRRLSG